MLRVRDNSMLEDHIDAGDLIIVRRQSDWQDGDTVVAVIHGDQATLKRLYREDGRIRLEPANQAPNPIYVDSDRIQIHGVVVSVIRQIEASPAE